MKRALSLVLVLALCLGALALAEEGPRVGISCCYGADGWLAEVARRAEVAAEELGLNYVLKISASAQEQAEDLDLLVEQGCEYIVLLPADIGLAAAARRAMAGGVVLLATGPALGDLVPDCFLEGEDPEGAPERMEALLRMCDGLIRGEDDAPEGSAASGSLAENAPD